MSSRRLFKSNFRDLILSDKKSLSESAKHTTEVKIEVKYSTVLKFEDFDIPNFLRNEIFEVSDF